MTKKRPIRILWCGQGVTQAKELIEFMQKEGNFDFIFPTEIEEVDSILTETSVSLIVFSLLPEGPDWRSVLEAARKGPFPVPVIFMGPLEVFPRALEAVKEGAADFIPLPSDPAAFYLKIRAVLEKRRLQEQVRQLQTELRFRRNSDYIVGEGIKIQKVLGNILKVSESDIPVLVSGESGTGKELIARAIHYNSRRAGEPFIVLTCAAVPEALLEGELFGFEKDSFNGGENEKPGLIDRANGGTLFIDEIRDLSESIQVKLLHVFEKKEFRRVGGFKPIKANIRFISATNRNLEQEMENKTFREELFYRLNGFLIKIPALRERREDIPQLANHFLKKYQSELNPRIRGFSPSAVQKLMFHSWRGNIRELENKVRQALLSAKGPMVYREDIELEREEKGTRLKTFKEAKNQFEREYILNILRITNGNVSEAARLSGKDRKDFYDVMKKHKIPIKRFRLA